MQSNVACYCGDRPCACGNINDLQALLRARSVDSVICIDLQPDHLASCDSLSPSVDVAAEYVRPSRRFSKCCKSCCTSQSSRVCPGSLYNSVELCAYRRTIGPGL